MPLFSIVIRVNGPFSLVLVLFLTGSSRASSQCCYVAASFFMFLFLVLTIFRDDVLNNDGAVSVPVREDAVRLGPNIKTETCVCAFV